MSDFFNNPASLGTYDFGTTVPASYVSPDFGVDALSSFNAGLSPNSASPSKPGAESPFANAWVGGSLLLEGIGNMIRGIRGMEPAPQGMATRMISDYLAQQRDEDRLNKILERIGGGSTDSSSILASALAGPAALKTNNPLRGLG